MKRLGYLYSIVLTLLMNHYFPSLKILPFLPFLALTITKSSLSQTMWTALALGPFIDGLQSQLPFGSYTLILLLSSLIIYRQRQLIVHDSLLSLPIFTMLYSILFLSLQFLLLGLFNHHLSLSWNMIAADFIIMSIYDGAFALIAFTLPILIYSKIKRLGNLRLFIKKKLRLSHR